MIHSGHMASDELIKYIKQQLAVGVEKATITRILLTSNWSEHDVNAAFAQAMRVTNDVLKDKSDV